MNSWLHTIYLAYTNFELRFADVDTDSHAETMMAHYGNSHGLSGEEATRQFLKDELRRNTGLMKQYRADTGSYFLFCSVPGCYTAGAALIPLPTRDSEIKCHILFLRAFKYGIKHWSLGVGNPFEKLPFIKQPKRE